MQKPEPYLITAPLQKWEGKGGWHFVAIPKKVSQNITKMFGYLKKSFGSIAAELEIGKSKWATSIFFDSKNQTYFAFIKSKIRQEEKLEIDDLVTLKIWIKV
jgi:Domain of unknown function (DUF1905)